MNTLNSNLVDINNSLSVSYGVIGCLAFIVVIFCAFFIIVRRMDHKERLNKQEVLTKDLIKAAIEINASIKNLEIISRRILYLTQNGKHLEKEIRDEQMR